MVWGDHASIETYMAQFRELLARFLADYCHNSRRSYYRVIDDWISYRTEGRWLKERALSHVTKNDAQAYLLKLSDSPGKPTAWGPAKASSNTIHHRHNVLRKYYRWLIEDGAVHPPNPFDFKLNIQQSKKREYDRLSDDQVGKLLMLSDCATVSGRRDNAIMCLLFGLGLRRAEIPRIAIGDILDSGEHVKLRIREQKSRKLSCIPCAPWVAAALLACRQDRINDGAHDSEPMFVKKDGPYMTLKPVISEWFVYRLFRDYAQRAGIRGSFSPHCARVTAITKALESGHNHHEVQELSRHSSVRMVELYDRRRTEDGNHPALKIDYARGSKTSCRNFLPTRNIE